MLKPTLEQHRAQITQPDCRWCGYKNLKDEKIQIDEHEGGWDLFGWPQKQWLWIECPGCGYQWALWKLGCGQKWHELEKREGGEENG